MRSISRGSGFQFLTILFLSLLSSFPTIAADYTTADGLSFTIPGTDGRVSALSIGGQTIAFCTEDGTSLTGGFYIRDNTPFDTGVLPIDPEVNPNLLDSESGCASFDELTCIGPGEFWEVSNDGDPPLEIAVVAVGDNNVARISVDENPNQPPNEGHYGAIYHDHTFSSYTSPEHELYYLVFEVKTGCGWRSKDHPQAYEDGGEFNLFKFGQHRVSARVEWFAGGGGTFQLVPTGASAPDIFYAYETTDAISGERLTRFCGRTYRPFNPDNGNQAITARIALVVEGYMPDDESTEYPENTVYFDNIAFFKAPARHQVYGDLPGTEVDLYKDAILPANDLGLNMTLNIEPIQPYPGNSDSYLLFTGSLINDDDNPSTTSPARSIDLGFAFPLRDDTSTGSASQQLEWHYDVSHASYVDVAQDVNGNPIGANRKIYPYTMSSHVDARPEYKMSGIAKPVNLDRKRSLGPQISSYPIGALAIHDPGEESNLRGLSFGDSLDLEFGEQVTPNISHFGYRIDRLTWDGDEDYVGYAYIEFNLGLPAEETPEGNKTDFSFILFRSDDEEYDERSVFREGLQKYQRSFYPEFFTRPTDTRPGEEQWLFGGAVYNSDQEQDGLDDRPNQFGIRYAQMTFTTEEPGLSEIQALLTHLYEKNVSALAYDHPWAANFFNVESNEMNTLSTMSDSAAGAIFNDPQQSIYDQKLLQIFSLPPIDDEEKYQKLFCKDIGHGEFGRSYRFPAAAAMTPDVDNESDPRIEAEKEYFSSWYQEFVFNQHSIAGLEFDNTYLDGHLDLDSVRVAGFAENGGRLTYSFNEFTPAVPQVTTNTWFFPHARTFLESIDDGLYQDYGDGNDAAGQNIEQEIIGINANQNDLGGSKYAILNADVIGFESSTQRNFNNSYESFNFRRSLARDKSVNRVLGPAECASTAAVSIEYGGLGALYTEADQLFVQILNENSWASLAYGFMPSIHRLLEECFDGDGLDDFFDDTELNVRGLFWTELPYSTDSRRGYTNIFQMLHLAGWRPVTNIVNIAEADQEEAPGDPQDLVINRFGPYDGLGPTHRPVYITLYNNAGLTQTFTDVAEYDCDDCLPIGELEREDEVEQLDICAENYGSDAFDGKYRSILDNELFDLRDRHFLLEIMNPDKLTLNGVGNLVGHQMIRNVTDGYEYRPVNDPVIYNERFGAYGDYYSIIRSGTSPNLYLGGGRSFSQIQGPGILMDKGLMVFKIWLEARGDNSGSGGGSERFAGDPYYRTFGSGWAEVDDASAENGSLDAVSTTVPGACALYRIDTGVNGLHRLRVKYPVYQEATGSARYDVYVMGNLEDAFQTLTLGSLPDPALSVVVDQSSALYTDVDDEGFAAIGEFEVSGLTDFGLASVVIRVSAEPDEDAFAAPGVLVADAVKLEAVE